MNFKTRLSYNNRVLFVYENGEVRQTPFTEVSFFGDGYILAKSETDTFFSLLDLDGNEKEGAPKVVHRFQNGLLLIYKAFKKSYQSSDSFEYLINYNVYSVLNYDTGKQYTAGIIQSDEIKSETEISVIHTKCVKTVIRYFLNKPLYCFKDFVFSEILDNQYVLTGSILLANPLHIAPGIEGYPDFDTYKNRKVWSVVDIFSQVVHTIQTDVAATTKYGLTFKDAELYLMEVMTMPERPEKVEHNEAIFNDLNLEYNIYRDWRNKNKWHRMLNNVLSFVRN